MPKKNLVQQHMLVFLLNPNFKFQSVVNLKCKCKVPWLSNDFLFPSCSSYVTGWWWWVRCRNTNTIKTSAKMFYTTCAQWNYLSFKLQLYIIESPLDAKWLLFQIKQRSVYVQQRLPSQIRSQAATGVQAAASWDAQWARSPKKRRSCALEPGAVDAAWKLCILRKSTYRWENLHNFWAAHFVTADDSPFPKGVHFHSHGQSSTSKCFLSPLLDAFQRLPVIPIEWNYIIMS